jgi:hypothetical protein
LLLFSVTRNINIEELLHLFLLGIVHIKGELQVVIVHGHGIRQRGLIVVLMHLEYLNFNLVRTVVQVGDPFVIGRVLL